MNFRMDQEQIEESLPSFIINIMGQIYFIILTARSLSGIFNLINFKK